MVINRSTLFYYNINIASFIDNRQNQPDLVDTQQVRSGQVYLNLNLLPSEAHLWYSKKSADANGRLTRTAPLRPGTGVAVSAPCSTLSTFDGLNPSTTSTLSIEVLLLNVTPPTRNASLF